MAMTCLDGQSVHVSPEGNGRAALAKGGHKAGACIWALIPYVHGLHPAPEASGMSAWRDSRSADCLWPAYTRSRDSCRSDFLAAFDWEVLRKIVHYAVEPCSGIVCRPAQGFQAWRQAVLQQAGPEKVAGTVFVVCKLRSHMQGAAGTDTGPA